MEQTNSKQACGKLKFESVKVYKDLLVNYINDLDLSTLIPLQTNQIINTTLSFQEITAFHDIIVNNYVNGYKLLDEYQNSILMNEFAQEIISDLDFRGNVLVRDNIRFLGLVEEKNLSNVVTTTSHQNLTATYIFNSDIIFNSNLILYGLLNGINVPEWQERSIRTYSEQPQTILDTWHVVGSVTAAENVDGEVIQGMDIRTMANRYEEKRALMISTQSELLNNYTTMCRNVNAITDTAKNQIYLFKYLENACDTEFNNNILNTHHFKVKNQDYIIITEESKCFSWLFTWSDSKLQEIGEVEIGQVNQFISVFDDDLIFLITRSEKNTFSCDIDGTNIWKFKHVGLIHLYKLEEQQLLQESLVPGTFYTLQDNVVVEYKLITTVETDLRILRKWIVNSENLAFVPRGLGTGLALCNGKTMFRLIREEVTTEDNYGYETEVFVRGSVKEESNKYLPGHRGNEALVINVGMDGYKRSLIAIASHEETSVTGKLDFIKIYENVLTGKIYHKVPTYKPSSLISLEFGNNGETLLIFLEDLKVLQVYEYKGIEGFKHRTSIKLVGSKLLPLILYDEKTKTDKAFVGLIHKNKLSLFEAVMDGQKMVIERPNCDI